MTETWGHKWASDIVLGDVLKLRHHGMLLPLIVSEIRWTPTRRHLTVSFEGGGTHRYLAGSPVTFLRRG